MKTVKKVWGKEEWIVNREYCGKLLYLDKGATSSLHRHLTKHETFYVLKGHVILMLDGYRYDLTPGKSLEIEPGDYHSFYGEKDSVIIEFSTHHDDNDVERAEPSKAAGGDK